MAGAEDTLDLPHPDLTKHPTASSWGTPGVGTTPLVPGGDIFASRYRILGLIGSGGMGAVYRARDEALDEIVALKVIRPDRGDDPGALLRFKQEVKLARKVTHPNVVRTFDLGEHEGAWFLTMEYIEGQSLSRRLAETGPLCPKEAGEIVLSICAALQAAHDADVVHRDLKPDNVLLAKDGRVLLTDFGIARARSGESATATGAGIIGTPAYMAPEQVDGSSPIGGAADVYALGAMMFEMLAGRRAWEGDNPLVVSVARLMHPPPDLRAARPTVPEGLASVTTRCMARPPALRFAAAVDVARAVEAALSGVDTAPSPTEVMSPPTQPKLPSIAVLPFRDSGAAEDRFLSEGLTEEVVDALSMTRGLRVRPLGPTRPEESDPREVGRRLEVEVVLDGSLRRSGDRVRVGARLIGVADGFQLWAQRFDGPASDLLVIADEVSHAVAKALTTEIQVPKRESSDATAVEHYLKAREAMRRGWHTELQTAVALLEKAVALSPHDATFLAWLSIARSRQAFWAAGESFETAMVTARNEARRAIELAPGLAEAKLALASIHFDLWEAPEAARILRRLLIDSPGLPRAHHMAGAMLLEVGRIREGLIHLRTAASLDPSARSWIWEVARGLALQGDWSAAEAVLDFEPEHDDARILRYATQCRQALWRRDPSKVPPAPQLDVPTHEVFGPWTGATLIAEILRTGALSAPHRSLLEKTPPRLSPRFRGVLTQIRTEMRLALGEDREAFALVEEVVLSGLCDVSWMDQCPLLEPLRKEPTFPELRDRVAARAAEVVRALDGG